MSESEKARRRVFGTILKNAVFSWQIAATFVFTVMLFLLAPEPFEFWQPWFWFVAGGMTGGCRFFDLRGTWADLAGHSLKAHRARARAIEEGRT